MVLEASAVETLRQDGVSGKAGGLQSLFEEEGGRALGPGLDEDKVRLVSETTKMLSLVSELT